MDVKVREKERWEIEELVFDRQTLLTLGRMMAKGLFKKLDYVVSTGKEANVYRAKASRGYVAVKIYKVETTRFSRKLPYLLGDPRFSLYKHSPRELTYLFASKEYKNLLIAEEAKLRAPKPLFHEKNVVVMSFIGRKGIAFPHIRKANLSKELASSFLQSIVEDMRKLYSKGLIHADLSEYNILFDEEREKYYIIDFSQGVLKDHPRAMEFLRRDIHNIVKFFGKFGAKGSEEEIFRYIIS